MRMILFDLCASRGIGTWRETAEAEGMTFCSYSADQLDTPEKRAAATAAMEQASNEDRVVVLYSNHGMEKELEVFFAGLSGTMTLVPIGTDAMLVNPGSLDRAHTAKLNEYVIYGGEENIRSAVLYLRRYAFGDLETPCPPEPLKLPFDGIYSLSSGRVFSSLEAFFRAEDRHYPVYVGFLSNRHSWMNRILQAEKALAGALHRRNIGVIPVFSAGEKSETVPSYDFDELIDHFFRKNGVPVIECLVSFQMHLIKGKDGMSAAEHAAQLFQALDVPVFNPISSYSVTRERWEQDPSPLAMELQSAYLNPEMAGMAEPALVALRDLKTNTVDCIGENIQAFAVRIQKWVALRNKPNREKQLAILLHNDVCAGVEATIGKAFGLDAMESVVRVLRRLSREGYTVEDIPPDGHALRTLIMEKRAYSDFRWTSVEDIVQSGGCLYRMPLREYETYFRALPPELQQQMLDSWGTPPGEGMVLDGGLIITGIRFGNILVMVQPKRGCYGAKCTGEVCRILHDPLCPPTHQYLATYRYLEQNWQADAVVHFGTDGSLEYLPGKASGLGQTCWPVAVLGSLPNFYPYHLGVVSEGTIAKRRANAVLTGYYPASSSGLNQDELALMDLLNRCTEACQLKNGQEAALQEELEKTLSSHPSLERLLRRADRFPDGVQLVRASLLHCAEGRKRSRLHVFGENPSHSECVRYLGELLYADQILERQADEDAVSYQRRLAGFLERRLEAEPAADPVSQDLKRVYQLLQQTEREQDSLIHALNGGYICPGEGGMPDENGRKILPTGRNFYLMNMDKVPTCEAYERGVLLAKQLLDAYEKDEGRCPRKIAMNMISVDIARTHGEQLSEFLYLLGVRPVWDRFGRVIRLEPVPLTELGRPRVDVTLRISGVLRDTWPDAVVLMDEAVLLVSSLEETEEENYILANIHQMERACGELGQRAKTIRIFGDPPGTFGAGIDLALKASAWQDDRDLARYFIQSSAYAYGKGLQGRRSIREFIQNAKAVDLSCDVTSSRRSDTLACGFGVQVQGGFRMVAKVLGKKEIRQYQAASEKGEMAETVSLSEQVERDIRQTLLNEAWRDSMMEDGTQGAADLMKRMQSVFDAKCANDCVQDATLDQLAQVYVNDPAMRQWLLEHNAYAAEEMARRLLELESRARWQPDPALLEQLRESYLTIEGCMEGVTGGNGEIQGGSVEIVRDGQVENWSRSLQELDAYLKTIEE